MPYITREDGERFVIPSYRDVLTVTQKSQLKKDIYTLSRNYGAYITLQAKGPNQYEVAFSPDPGYLLGESIWHHFNRPLDMIYCEAIPNSSEAILVIVKSGAVYLDGSFPLESIPEELIIFLTQQNNFEIYTYGDVPISQSPEPQKFSFESSSVKSFSILDKPVFPTLPLLKAYQLQLVEQVLKAHGIGIFPVKSVIYIVALVAIGWLGWSYLKQEKVEAPVVYEAPKPDPYLSFYSRLTSPAPDEEIKQVASKLSLLNTMAGWNPVSGSYTPGSFIVLVVPGSNIELLKNWAYANGASVSIGTSGVFVALPMSIQNRLKPKVIYSLNNTIATLIDRIVLIYPGNHIQLGELKSEVVYSSIKINIMLESVTPIILALIGEQLKDLPLILTEIRLGTISNGQLTGTITLEGLGN